MNAKDREKMFMDAIDYGLFDDAEEDREKLKEKAKEWCQNDPA